MAVLIEQRHIDAAKAAGACSLKGIRVGMDVSELDQSSLDWVQEHCPDLAREAADKLAVPLWCASRSGYGSGYGESLQV